MRTEHCPNHQGRPLVFVTDQRGPITTDLEVVDGRSTEETVNNFFEEYQEDIPSPSFCPIISQDVKHALRHANNSAIGSDQWRQVELGLMEHLFCKWIADICNMAETGPGWQEDLRMAWQRAHSCQKNRNRTKQTSSSTESSRYFQQSTERCQL